MRKIFIFFSLSLIVFFGFAVMSVAQQQTEQEQLDQQKLDQQKLEQQQQLEQQRLDQQYLAQQQQLEQQQLAQQQQYQQESAQQSEVVMEPDMSFFGDDYSTGRYAYDYSHRGYESRGEAHFEGGKPGRR